MDMRRASGILLHPTSLPGTGAIGDLGPGAHGFVELLASAGQSLWQVLPLGPTGYGDSPYASLSSFAGNELLLSLELLSREGFLTPEDAICPSVHSPDRVDFGAAIAWKLPVLFRAADAFLAGAAQDRRAAYGRFVRRESRWLRDYCLFRALKDTMGTGEAQVRDLRPTVPGGGAWNESWPAPLAARDPGALERAASGLRRETERYAVLQFFFDEQWRALKLRANRLGVSILGDIPIFVAEDSADAWSRQDLLLLDGERKPAFLAGVPPDYFSDRGQLWGNPLYDWDAHRREGFAWWTDRIGFALERHDCLRIDHFRGFESYYAIPAGSPDARGGSWRPGPGEAFFRAVREALHRDGSSGGSGEPASPAGRHPQDLPIVAEDLGFITPEVRELRDAFGFPGMRILQFAFDARESGTAFDPGNGFLPHNYGRRTVVYTGTHDNTTAAGWWEGASEAERAYARAYLGLPEDTGTSCRFLPGGSPVAECFVREAMKSVADWAVIPMQDILGLGAGCRMNTPSTLGGNWTWRMREGAFDEAAVRGLRSMTELYGRSMAR